MNEIRELKDITIHSIEGIDTDNMVVVDKDTAVDTYNDNKPVYLFSKATGIDEIINHNGKCIIEGDTDSTYGKMEISEILEGNNNL